MLFYAQPACMYFTAESVDKQLINLELPSRFGISFHVVLLTPGRRIQEWTGYIDSI